MFTPDSGRALAAIAELEAEGLITSEPGDPGLRIQVTETGKKLIEQDDDEPEGVSVVTPYSSLKLLELRVDRVKCFAQDQRLSIGGGGFNPRWTILIGDNGVGKTTLLQLVAALWPGAESVDGETAPALQFRSDLQRVFQPNHLSQGTARAEAVFQAYVEHEPKHLLTGTCIGYSLDKLFPELELGFERISVSSGRNGMTYTGNFDLTGRPLLVGYGATRVVGSTSLARKDQLGNVASLFDQEQVLRNPEEWLLQADYARRLSPDDKQTAARYGRIREALLSILPGVTALNILPPTEESSSAAVLFATELGIVPYAELGLGYQSTIAWMVDLASRLFDYYPRLADPLAGEALVLIDEIDLHLHPAWQRSLLADLCRIFPNVQFIATTHSPLVVQGAAHARIYLLRKESGVVRIVEETEEIENWRVDQILTSDLFGVESPRSKRIGALEAKRTDLLSKPVMSAGDRAEVERLEREIGDPPVGESEQDRDAMAFLREVARKMREA